MTTHNHNRNNFTRILTKIVLVLVSLVFLYNLDNFIITHSDAANSDFSYLWAGGYAVDTGHSPYDPVAIANIFQQIGHDRIDPAISFPYPLYPQFTKWENFLFDASTDS
jgi:hypothetical protein